MKESDSNHITTQKFSVQEIRIICLETLEWDSLTLAIYHLGD